MVGDLVAEKLGIRSVVRGAHVGAAATTWTARKLAIAPVDSAVQTQPAQCLPRDKYFQSQAGQAAFHLTHIC